MRSLNKNPLAALSGRGEVYLVGIILALAVCLNVATGGTFLSAKNLTDILLTNLYLGIMALGMLVVIISGGIDLSCLATATVAQYLMARYLLTANSNMFVALVIVIAVGVILGGVNGYFVYKFKVPSMIITIATMNIFYGVLQWATGSRVLYKFPSWFSKRGMFGTWAPVVIFALLALLTWHILRNTKIGRNIYAAGGNFEAAKRVGVNMLRTQMFIYCYIGALSGVAGLIQLYFLRNFSPNTLVGLELDVVAMVVIGGASLMGGKGTCLGTLLGVALLAIISNGLVLTRVSSYVQPFVTGAAILVGVVFMAGLTGRRNRKANVKSAERQG